ncbi:MAG: recombinase family protein [Holophagales bacterium]|nr:recombinase family protein [Holophagales bacterium]
MRAAIYVRKSTESDDRQVLSLSAQVVWAREACARLGIADPVLFEEKQSAKTPGRPEFNRLMTMVEKGALDTVLCWKADRLARNALDGGRVVWAMETKKLTQVVTADRTYIGEPDEEFILSLELGLSAKYSKDLSKNIRRGIQEKLRRGEWPCIAPLGYRNLRESADHAVIVVDEPMAKIVRELFRLAASGSYSLAALARTARDGWGLTLPKRRPNTTAKGLGVTTVDHILKNPFYYGAMRVKGQLYAGTHSPLVTKDLFDRVQEIVAARRTKAERPKSRVFALTGLVRCAKCGRRLTAYTQAKPSGKVYCYYTCTNRMRRRCDLPPVSELAAFVPVRETLKKLSFTERDVDLALGMVAELRERASQDLVQRSADLNTRINEVKKAQGTLLDLLLSGTVPRADYERKRADLGTTETNFTLERDGLADSRATKLEQLRSYFGSLKDAVAVFDAADAAGKKDLLRRIGIELEADDDGARVLVGKPASVLLNRAGAPVTWRLLEDALRAIDV